MSKNTREMERVAREIRIYADRLKDAAGNAVRMVGEEILTDVKTTRGNRGVPKDTGALANSGRVEQLTTNVARISFGGAAAPYALVQHERTDFFHPQGEPRYLVRGFERWQSDGSGARKALAEMQAIVEQNYLRKLKKRSGA